MNDPLNSKERVVLIFLIAVLLAGTGINYFRRVRRQAQLQAITIRCRADTTAANRLDSLAPPEPASTGLIDLNSASAAELELLPGIGPAISQRIIEYRKVHNGFKTREELLKVSGIGPKRYAAIKDRVTVGS